MYSGKDDIRELERATRHRPPVLFLGAGFSVEAGYASTTVLRGRIAAALGASEENLDVANLESLADRLSARHGPRALNRILYDLYCRPPAIVPRSYEIIRSHAEWTPIITTNFDVGLCRFLNVDPIFDVETFIERSGQAEPAVLHLHGHASFLAKHRVITSGEYGSFYDQGGSQLLLSELIKYQLTRNIVFIGYGMRDRNIRRIFAAMKQRQIRSETIWMVGPEAIETALDDSVELGVPIRPIGLNSSEFFEGYDKRKRETEREGYVASLDPIFSMRTDRARPMLVALLQYLDNSTLSEDLSTALLEDENRVQTLLYLPVAPGSDQILIDPVYGERKGAVVLFRCRYRDAEVRIPVRGTAQDVVAKVRELVHALPAGFSVDLARARVAVQTEDR